MMKNTLALVFVVLIAAVFVSGCTQQAATNEANAAAAGTSEDQAFNAVDQELDQAIAGMTVEDMENELLQQG